MLTFNLFLEIVLLLGTAAIWVSFIRNLFKGEFGLDIIAGVALLSTIFAKQYLAGVVVLVMFVGGQVLEYYAFRRAKKELSLLLSRTPTVAHLKISSGFLDVELEKIKPGDIVLVKVKEIIPVDGVVVEGETSVNESVLTGESESVVKGENSLVFAGTENISNPIFIRVSKFSHETKYNEILQLVKNNENNKAKIVRLADKYSIYFTLLTFAVATFTWFFTGDFVRVIAVLVVATPCPLLIATPIAIISGMSKAFKKGILIKSGVALETLAQVKHFVFDKTGTITFGSPKVVQVISFTENSPDKIFTKINSLEQPSTHIFARAVGEYAKEIGNTEFYYPTNFHEDFGYGVSGMLQNEKYFVGKKSFLEMHNLKFDGEILKAHNEANENSQAIIFLGNEKKALGAILLEDEVRPESKNIFKNFISEGLKISILTGDKEEHAKKIAEHLHVDEVVANATPAKKLEYIKEVGKKNVVSKKSPTTKRKQAK
jgi:heavy metal translocating P-type ATPase